MSVYVCTEVTDRPQTPAVDFHGCVVEFSGFHIPPASCHRHFDLLECILAWAWHMVYILSNFWSEHVRKEDVYNRTGQSEWPVHQCLSLFTGAVWHRAGMFLVFIQLRKHILSDTTPSSLCYKPSWWYLVYCMFFFDYSERKNKCFHSDFTVSSFHVSVALVLKYVECIIRFINELHPLHHHVLLLPGGVLRLWHRRLTRSHWNFWDHVDAPQRSFPHISGMTVFVIQEPNCTNKNLSFIGTMCQTEAVVSSSGRVWLYQQQKEAEEKRLQELWCCEREAVSGIYRLWPDVFFRTVDDLCLILQVVKEFTFLDYIMGGCQINFTVSLDFCRFGERTDSICGIMWVFRLSGGCRLHRLQRGPQVPRVSALHQPSGRQRVPLCDLVRWPSHPGLWQVRMVHDTSSTDEMWQNTTARFTSAAGSWPRCLLFLCSDKMFPAFGFGAQIPPSWKVNKSDTDSDAVAVHTDEGWCERWWLRHRAALRHISQTHTSRFCDSVTHYCHLLDCKRVGTLHWHTD